MMIMEVKFLIFATAIAASSSNEQEETFDLFLDKSYTAFDSQERVFNYEASCESSPCGGGDGSCAASNTNYWVANQCVATSDATISVQLSWSKFAIVDNNRLCERFYSDASCTEQTSIDDETCLVLDQCTEDNSRSVTQLANWCIVSNEPKNEYTMPLVTVRDYNNRTSCEESSLYFAEYHFPGDPNYCSSESGIRYNDGRVGEGSYRASCQGSGGSGLEYLVQAYTDAQCKLQDEALVDNFTSVTKRDECSPTAFGGRFRTVNCGGSDIDDMHDYHPLYHCKPLSNSSGSAARDVSSSIFVTAAVAASVLLLSL